MPKPSQKLHSKAGFTLGETLLAVLILLMATYIVAAGIPVAKNAYEKVVVSANAEVLLSTTMSALRNELQTARNVKAEKQNPSDDAETVLTYYSKENGTNSRLYLDSTNGIMYRRYADLSPTDAPDPVRLVSAQASTNGLFVTYDSVTYNKLNGRLTVNGLKVCGRGYPPRENPFAERSAFTIQVIQY